MGTRLSARQPVHAETEAQACQRINELVRYIETLQQR